MAKWRAIHRDISSSGQVNQLSEFAQLLFERMILWADDWGIITADPLEIKLKAIPGSTRTLTEIEEAVVDMERVGLVQRYEADQYKSLLFFPQWDRHQPQSLIGKRTTSDYPLPPYMEDTLSASETDIEDYLYDALTAGTLLLSDSPLIQINRQSRIENSYIDILCRDDAGHVFILEIKRQRLSTKALEQVLRYADLLREHDTVDVAPILIGYGLSLRFDVELAQQKGVDVIVFGDDLKYKQVVSSNVTWRYLTSNAVNAKTRQDKNRQDKNRTDQTTTDKSENVAVDDDPQSIRNQKKGILEEIGVEGKALRELSADERITPLDITACYEKACKSPGVRDPVAVTISNLKELMNNERS